MLLSAFFHASRLFYLREPLSAQRCGRQAALAATSGPHYATRLLRRESVNGFGGIRRSGPHHGRRKLGVVRRIRKVLRFQADSSEFLIHSADAIALTVKP